MTRSLQMLAGLMRRALVVVAIGMAGLLGLLHVLGPPSSGGAPWPGAEQVAAVTVGEPAGIAPEPALPIDETADQALVRSIQQALVRVGCYDGPIDGRWSLDARRGALRLVEVMNLSLRAEVPEPGLLAAIAASPPGSCALKGLPRGEVLVPSTASLKPAEPVDRLQFWGGTTGAGPASGLIGGEHAPSSFSASEALPGNRSGAAEIGLESAAAPLAEVSPEITPSLPPERTRTIRRSPKQNPSRAFIDIDRNAP